MKEAGRRAIGTFGALALLTTTACTSNTINGPPRLVGAASNGSGIYGPDGSLSSCPSTGAASLNLVADFVAKACAAHAVPDSPQLASVMVNSGITLNRIRCADFFRQRGAGQTTERILRRTIVPLSALITNILGIIDFDGDEDRQQAIQILGISIAGVEGGLSVYEEEFLFGAENIRSVEVLTMRDLDTHALEILNRGSGFYQALRDLLDHQALCRPTAILELAQDAIRNGRIRTRINDTGGASTRRLSPAEVTSLNAFTAALGTSVNIEQLGALWWLANDDTNDPEELVVISNRLGNLSGRYLTTANNRTSRSTTRQALLDSLSQQFGAIPAPTLERFRASRDALRVALKDAENANAVQLAAPVSFGPPSSVEQLNGGAVETAVEPVGQPNQP